jgi:predicted GNAT family acetyltransferase
MATLSPVRDNKEMHRFEIDADGKTAFITYRPGNGILTFLHEEVPKEVGGQGVGTALVKGTLDIVRAQGLKLVPRCPFMAAYIRKHPEYSDLVVGPPP